MRDLLFRRSSVLMRTTSNAILPIAIAIPLFLSLLLRIVQEPLPYHVSLGTKADW